MTVLSGPRGRIASLLAACLAFGAAGYEAVILPSARAG